MIDPDHLKGFHQVPAIQNIETQATASEEEEKDTREREDTEKVEEGAEIWEEAEEGGEVEDIGGQQGARPGAPIGEAGGAGEEAALTTGGEDTVNR